MSVVRIGICGMGAAGQAFVPALRRNPGFEWVALAEPVPEQRATLASENGVAGYADLDALLRHPGLDAVYLATPTELHAAQAIQVAQAGLHVLVEKPMAPTLAEARAMAEAAERAGVVLLVGHSHSHDLPIRRMHELVASGELGAVAMANSWCYTDWVRRPRRPEELDATRGGGVTFRQGAHQFDILRLLCGGLAHSVRARSFDLDPRRRTTGAHTVWIEFANGSAATAVYNGYGRFSSMDLCGDISEWGFRQPPESRVRPASTQGLSAEEELRAKQKRSRGAIPAQAPHQPFFGLTLVSCERGDVRQSPDGLLVYGDEGVREIPLSPDRSPRELVLDEFHEAIAQQRRPLHDGRWGLATLEICVAALQSAATGTEVRLREQVAAPHPRMHQE